VGNAYFDRIKKTAATSMDRWQELSCTRSSVPPADFAHKIFVPVDIPICYHPHVHKYLKETGLSPTGCRDYFREVVSKNGPPNFQSGFDSTKFSASKTLFVGDDP
jgi:hypothetical protein